MLRKQKRNCCIKFNNGAKKGPCIFLLLFKFHDFFLFSCYAYSWYILVGLGKCMKKPKICLQDSAPRPTPVWTVSRMRIPQRQPTRMPPASVCSALNWQYANFNLLVWTLWNMSIKYKLWLRKVLRITEGNNINSGINCCSLQPGNLLKIFC